MLRSRYSLAPCEEAAITLIESARRSSTKSRSPTLRGTGEISRTLVFEVEQRPIEMLEREAKGNEAEPKLHPASLSWPVSDQRLEFRQFGDDLVLRLIHHMECLVLDEVGIVVGDFSILGIASCSNSALR